MKKVINHKSLIFNQTAMHQISLKLQRLIFFTLILFLPTQLGRHFWPSWSYVSGLRVDYLSPTLYATDLLIIALFLSWLLSSEAKFTIPNFQFSIKHQITNFKFQFILFMLAILFGIIQSKNPQAGLYGLVKLLEFGFFGFYTAKIARNQKDRMVVISLLSLGVLFESCLAIAQYLNQGSIGGIFYWFGERTFTSQTPGIANASLNGKLVLRPYATFPHPNVLAGYLIIVLTMIRSNFKFQMLRLCSALILSLPNGLISNQTSNLKTIIFFTSIFLGSAALFLTMSRVAIFIWVILVIFYLKSLIINHKLFVSLLVLIGSIVVAFPLSSRFLNFSASDESVVRRVELINTAVAMVKAHPLFGVGLFNFLPSLPYFQKSNVSSLFTSIQPVHNIYLLVLSETGVVGFCFFIWILIKAYKRIMNYELRITEKKKSVIHYSLFIILILGLFDHYFLTLQQGQLLFAFVLGLCLSNSNKELV